MFDELRERIAGILAAHHVGLLGACGWGDLPAVLPAAYRSRGLAVACLLPRRSSNLIHPELEATNLPVYQSTSLPTRRFSCSSS